MPDVPSIFPLWRIVLTAAIAFAASLVLLLWRFKNFSRRESLLIAFVVSLSVLAWRASGNIPPLNDDPVSALSPNDWICPVMTYVFLGVYAAFRRPSDMARWERVRALLTAISFIANVLTI